MRAARSARPPVTRLGAVLLFLVTIGAVVALVAALPVFGMHSYRIATNSAPSQLEFDALATGTLDGRVNGDGTACFWLRYGTAQHALLWPFGYSAKGLPLSVYNENGQRVADVGRRMDVGGGLAPPEVRSILGCPGTSHIWLVGHVVSQT